MNKCIYCKKDTTNTKFCSRSCSVSYNNIQRGIYSQKTYCHCGNRKDPRSDMCNDCSKQARRDALTTDQTPIKDLFYSSDANKYNHIRGRARSVFFEFYGNSIKCISCGYDKHVNVCHVIPIKDFPDDTPVSVVNAKENLVGLCPNCHWEYDAGILKI